MGVHAQAWPNKPVRVVVSQTAGAAPDIIARLLADRLAKDKTDADKPTVTEERLKTISKRYTRLLKTMKEYDKTEILELFLTALSHAYDPHSDYMAPADAKNFDIHNVKLKLNGIGAQLRQDDEGYTEIVNLTPGGPAELSKQLKPKDRIVAVAQGSAEPVECLDMKLGEVVDMIRGKKGTKVKLKIRKEAGGVEEIELTRTEVKITEDEVKGKIIEASEWAPEQKAKIGILRIPSFYRDFQGANKGGDFKSTSKDVTMSKASFGFPRVPSTTNAMSPPLVATRKRSDFSMATMRKPALLVRMSPMGVPGNSVGGASFWASGCTAELKGLMTTGGGAAGGSGGAGGAGRPVQRGLRRRAIGAGVRRAGFRFAGAAGHRRCGAGRRVRGAWGAACPARPGAAS